MFDVTNMPKYAGLLVIACWFICLTFNSTLPLYRDSMKVEHKGYDNQSQRCDLIERTKKMASNLEHTLKRIKDSTQDLGKSIFDHLNTGIKNLANKDGISEDEIKKYEELVIMKKYPYLDLKELEMKYSPLSSKNTRQSTIIAVDRNLQSEPGICDTADDILNVEIINRGLSGFSIPALLAKPKVNADGKLLNDIVIKTNNGHENGDNAVLKGLKDDVNAYLQRKNP